MLKQLKLKTKVQPVYLTSDPHWCHQREFLWGNRGYKSPEEHNEIGAKLWNETVPPNAIVICLGDWMLNGSKELCEEFFNKLNGKIYYIWGNHENYTKKVYQEAVLTQFGRGDIEVYPLVWNDKVTFLGEYVEGFIDNIPFVASHFAFRVWNGVHIGAIALSGHSHSTDIERNPEWPTGKALDVGIDNFKKPISFQEVMNIMNKKQMVQVDHHGQNTSTSF